MNRNTIIYLFAVVSMVAADAEVQKNETERSTDPYLVQININDGKGTELEPKAVTKTCTGIIVKRKVVLSACHCFTDDGHAFYDPSGVEVIAGTGNAGDEPPLTQKIGAAKIVPHPYCGQIVDDLWRRDLALVILDTRLDFIPNVVWKVETAHRISGLQVLMEEAADCQVHALEPGVKDLPEEGPKKPVVNNVTLMDDATCHKQMCQLTDPDSFFCQKEWWEDGFVCAYGDGCLGHSGGALICNGTLYGVDTFIPCEQNNFPKPITNLAVIKFMWRAFFEDSENKVLASLKRKGSTGSEDSKGSEATNA